MTEFVVVIVVLVDVVVVFVVVVACFVMQRFSVFSSRISTYLTSLL
jgi:hypothetical protein